MTSKKTKKTPSKKISRKTPAPTTQSTTLPAATTPPYPGYEPYDVFQVYSAAGWTDYDTLRNEQEAAFAVQKVEQSRTGEYRIVSTDKQTVKVPPTQPRIEKATKTRGPAETTTESPAEEAPATQAPAKTRRTKKVQAEAKKPKKLSALDAAAKVLATAGEAMTIKALIEAMTAQGLWTSPAGKTPAATLYAAILREIATKGSKARFRKTTPGHFAANNDSTPS